MKSCETYAALLDLYVDAELTPEEMDDVRQHLDSCPECQAYVDFCLQLRAEMPDAEDTPVPDGFAEAVMERIRPTSKKQNHWVRAVLPLAACCAVLLLVQGVMDSRSSSNESAAYTTATTTAPTAMAALDLCPQVLPEPESACDSAQNGKSEECQQAVEAPQAVETPQAVIAPAEAGLPAGKSMADAGIQAEITLSAEEAAAYLADFVPLQESDGESLYLLSREEYDALLAELESAGIQVEETVLEGTASDVLIHAVHE